jgi:eight-cysteine-cluster-containing protein
MQNRIASFSFGLALALVSACVSSSGQAPPPSASPAPAPTASADCAPTGCSGIICAEAGKEVMSTCEYKAEYACYAKAKCEKQADGACGWTRSADFDACIAGGGAK